MNGIDRRRGQQKARKRRRQIATLLLAAAVTATILALVAPLSGPDRHGARLIHYSILSPGLGEKLPQTAVVPANATRSPPLLVFLHGKGQDQDSSLTGKFYSSLNRLGAAAPDVVFPYGGEDSYWHDRRDHDWGKYVLDQVIPQAIRRLHADPTRVAIAGLSMGGFGAYDLARLQPGRFCAVGGHSPALWHSGGETAAGAFDDAEDFERHNMIALTRSSTDPYRSAKLWLDVGSEDPFRSADTDLAAELKAKGLPITFHIWPGGHDETYWDSHWNQYLRFYARALGDCAKR